MRFIFLMLFLICFLLSLDSHFKSFLKFWKSPEIKKIKVIATAYYKPEKKQKKFFLGSYEKDCKMNGNGITYTGEKAKIGTIAADLEIFPPGTKLFIPDYGWGVVKDIGSRIKGNRIDLFMGEGEKGLKRAIEWGEREVVIFKY